VRFVAASVPGRPLDAAHSLPPSPLDSETSPKADFKPDFLLWQLADSAFPTGGFTHSGGLEAAWYYGEVTDANELESFVAASLWQFSQGSLPFMAATYREPQTLIEFDQLCENFTLNHVANRASRAQGRALLLSAQRIFGARGLSDAPQPLFCHLAPVFGVVMRSLNIEFGPACGLFVFSHLRNLIAAAVRLGIVGALQGQALQNRLAPRAQEMLTRCQNLRIDEIAQVSPLLDLWQGTHDNLYSRLFQS